MNRFEEVIHDNQVKINYIKELIEKWSYEFENGYWKQVLQGQLEGLENINKSLEKE